VTEKSLSYMPLLDSEEACATGTAGTVVHTPLVLYFVF
jgi:hypothetical protein